MLTVTQDLVRCDTFHIQYYHHCLTQSCTTRYSRWNTQQGTREHLNAHSRQTNLSHGYTDANIWANKVQELKHILNGQGGGI